MTKIGVAAVAVLLALLAYLVSGQLPAAEPTQAVTKPVVQEQQEGWATPEMKARAKRRDVRPSPQLALQREAMPAHLDHFEGVLIDADRINPVTGGIAFEDLVYSDKEPAIDLTMTVNDRAESLFACSDAPRNETESVRLAVEAVLDVEVRKGSATIHVVDFLWPDGEFPDDVTRCLRGTLERIEYESERDLRMRVEYGFVLWIRR